MLDLCLFRIALGYEGEPAMYAGAKIVLTTGPQHFGEDYGLVVDQFGIQHSESLCRDGRGKANCAGCVGVCLIKVGEHLKSKAALYVDVYGPPIPIL